VGEAIAGYLAALEQSDAAAAAEYWDPDTRILAPGMDAGRQAVVDGIRSLFDAGTHVDVLSRRTLELLVTGDVAYELAQAEEVLVPRGTTPPDTLRNNIFVRWKKGSDGKWRFHRVLIGPQASPGP
jgi:ketosteroid isomerase-like protein